MATMEDAAALALAFPEVTEGTRHGHRTWFVAGKAFAWERPFSKADLRRYGTVAPPTGPILAVAVEDLAEKEAILADGQAGVFTISHFDGYAAVLVELGAVDPEVLGVVVEDAWLAGAPRPLAEAFLAGRDPGDVDGAGQQP